MSNELVVLENQMKPLMPAFQEALANRMPAERFTRTLIMSCEKLPKLLQCDRQSLFNAAMTFAVLGLEVDGVTGQGFIIPFGNRAQPVIGYKGLSTIAARAGLTITGSVVRDGDVFEYALGTGAFVRHVPKLDNEGRIIAAWAQAEAKGRPPVIEVMGIRDLMAVKAKSPGAKKSDSPWNDPTVGFPAMCAKTVKRRLARSTPMELAGADFHYAAAIDEAYEERGAHAYIAPAETPGGPARVVIDAEVTETSQPTADDLTKPKEPDILIEARAQARKGRDAMLAWWNDVATRDQKMQLQPHLTDLRALASDPAAFFMREGSEAAEGGKEVLAQWYDRLTPEDRALIGEDGFKKLDALAAANG